MRFLYWLAVVLVSVALVIALILLLESLDESSVEGALLLSYPPVTVVRSSLRTSLAKTTLRRAAL